MTSEGIHNFLHRWLCDIGKLVAGQSALSVKLPYGLNVEPTRNLFGLVLFRLTYYEEATDVYKPLNLHSQFADERGSPVHHFLMILHVLRA